jgi:hypothetical protein
MIRVSIASYYKPLIMMSVALLLCAGLLASPAAGGREVHLVPAVYVFGDSTVDVGNNQYLTGNSALQLPYGIDFPHSRPTGRFSNGYNVADFVGQCTNSSQISSDMIGIVFIFTRACVKLKCTHLGKLKCSETGGFQAEPAGLPVADAKNEPSDHERLPRGELCVRWIRHPRHHCE